MKSIYSYDSSEGTIFIDGQEASGARWPLPGGEIRLGDGNSVEVRRDRFASTPIYYLQLPSVLHIATRWPDILRPWQEAPVELGPDLDYIQDYIRFQCPATPRTFLAGVGLLRNGEYLRTGPNGELHTGRIPCDTGQPSDEAALLKNLELEIPKTAGAVFHLSSGLDSSLLVLLAANQGLPVKAASCKTRGRGAATELDLVERLAAQLDIALDVFDFTDIDIWEAGRQLMEALPFPIAHPSHLVRYLLDREIAKTSHRIVTGRGPDEVLGGYQAHTPQFADSLAHLERIRCTPEETVRALFLNGASTTSQTVAHHMALLGTGNSTLRQRLDYDLWSIYEAWNILEQGLSEALSVEYQNPFLSPRLMAGFYSLPDEEKVHAGEQKRFLRSRFSRLYPDYLLNTGKMGLTLDLRAYWQDYDASEIERRLYETSAFGPRYLERSACRKMIDETLNDGRNFGWQLWSLYLCALSYDRLCRPAMQRGRDSSFCPEEKCR